MKISNKIFQKNFFNNIHYNVIFYKFKFISRGDNQF